MISQLLPDSFRPPIPLPAGPMPPFMSPYGFGWPNPQQFAQQAQQFMQQAAAGLSPAGSLQQPLPSPSQLAQQAQQAQREQQAGTPKPEGESEQAAPSLTEQMQAMLAQQQGQAMFAQQQGQHQAQYAWMLQQYSMAAVAAAAAGQPPPLPPPPPPLGGGFMGWMPRPPMPWQQAMPPGLQFPLPGAAAAQGSASQPSTAAAPQAQPPASAGLQLPPLPPGMLPSGAAAGDTSTPLSLPLLPLLPLPLPGDVTTTSGAALPPLLPSLSQEALAKKEARRQASLIWFDLVLSSWVAAASGVEGGPPPGRSGLVLSCLASCRECFWVEMALQLCVLEGRACSGRVGWARPCRLLVALPADCLLRCLPDWNVCTPGSCAAVHHAQLDPSPPCQPSHFHCRHTAATRRSARTWSLARRSGTRPAR